MTTLRYFAYGSNMLTAWLQPRCASARATGIASVAGYRLVFSKQSKDGSGKAMLVTSDDPAARVYGVLYEIAKEEVSKLDWAEGRGKGYERVDDFEVLADGNAFRVMTYMADKTAINAALKPYDWYRDLTVTGAEENGLPPDYVATLRDTPSVPDPKPDRPTHKRAIAILKGRP